MSLVSSADFDIDILLAALYKHLIKQDSGVKKMVHLCALITWW